MLQKFVIGTLSTINTVMSPIAGPVNTKPVYKLESTELRAHDRCSGRKSNSIGMQVESLGKTITVEVKGSVCGSTGERLPVLLTMTLPSDLLDEEFIDHLPSGSGYVVSGVPIAGNASGMSSGLSSGLGRERKHKSRIKLSKGAPEGDTVPIRVEWLTGDRPESETPAPLTIWFSRKEAHGLPWRKIEFSALAKVVHKPMGISSEITTAGLEKPRRSL